MEFTIFSNKQGCGYIAENALEAEDICIKNKEPIKLGRQELLPGYKYDLDNFFNKPLRFIGIHPSRENCLIFYIGEDGDKYYYQAVFKIIDTKFFMMYAPDSGRDYNFKDNRWK